MKKSILLVALMNFSANMIFAQEGYNALSVCSVHSCDIMYQMNDCSSPRLKGKAE